MQKFIPGSPDTEGISSLAISANRKFVAVAEKAEKGMITVYDLNTLKRRKVLTTADLGSKVRFAFAPLEERRNVTTGAPQRARCGTRGGVVVAVVDAGCTGRTLVTANWAGSTDDHPLTLPYHTRITRAGCDPKRRGKGEGELKTFLCQIWRRVFLHTRVSLTPSTRARTHARSETAPSLSFPLVAFPHLCITHPQSCHPPQEYVSMSFSADGKLLIAQGGAPEWNVVLWNWEKSKVSVILPARASNQQSAPIHQVLFNPSDPTTASLVGNGIFKTYKVADTGLKPQPSALGKREPQNYTCHSWLPEEGKERCVVASDSGELLLVENNELKATIPASPEGVSIDCIIPFGNKGFICGGDNGILSIYERSEEKEMYKRTKSFSIENHAVRIKNLALSPSEENLICTLEDNQMYVLGLSNSDILKSEEMNFDLLSQGFHSQGVTGVDTCVRKPLVATCSTDKSVRIWNYNEKSSELVKFFPEEAYSIAFHPSGLHVLVGFADKLRLMNLLMDDIRPYKEFSIKQCKECVFSNGGNYFAAVHGNVIQIYNMYTCENVGNLRGHNGKVRSVCWSTDDTKIVSAGLDGAVYEWKLKDFKREKENVLKGCNYTCVVSTPDSRNIYAVGSDKKLKEFDETNQISKEFPTGSVLTQVVLPASGRTLFAASELGTVRSYKFPLNGEFAEYQCHSAPITRMRISFDDSLLFCVSEDACLFVFDVRDKEGRASGKPKEVPVYAEEVLVTKSDLEEKRGRMSELELQVNELTLQNEYQLRLKDLNMNEKIKDLSDKFQSELDGDKTKFELLLQEKNEQEMEYEEKLKQSEERHAQQMAALEVQYQQKIMTEVERYQQLLQEKELLNERWDEQNSLLVESHERVIQELTGEYHEKLQEEQMHLERVQQERDKGTMEFEETKRQLEEDADREIEELKERYEQKLAAEREIGLRLKGENGIMKKKFNNLQKDINEQKDEIQQLFDQKKDLYSTISSLEKDINGLKKEIKERDETIGDKEKRIYDLKKKNQELEKFKFVLDYKIKELKKQIEPREQDIQDMKEQIKEMDHELERYHKNNANLDLTISDLRLKLDGLQKEVLVQRKTIQDREASIQRFHHDLHATTQAIQDPKHLKEAVKKLYQKHVTDHVDEAEIDEDIQKEYNRQREYLERSVESLKRKLHKDMELHRTDNMRIMQENVSLIKEINELRREVKQARQQQVASGTSKRNTTTKGSSRTSLGLGGGASMSSSMMMRGGSGGGGGGDVDVMREIEIQRNEMAKLRLENDSKGARIKELEERVVVHRPMSASRLPPMEGLETVISMPDIAPEAEHEYNEEGEEEEAEEEAEEKAEEEAAPAAEVETSAARAEAPEEDQAAPAEEEEGAAAEEDEGAAAEEDEGAPAEEEEGAPAEEDEGAAAEEDEGAAAEEDVLQPTPVDEAPPPADEE